MLLLPVVTIFYLLAPAAVVTGTSYLPFLDVESRTTATTIRHVPYALNQVIFPSPLQFGNYSYYLCTVTSVGILGFGLTTIDFFYSDYYYTYPFEFPVVTTEAKLANVTVISPYWSNIGLEVNNGSIVYELLNKTNGQDIIEQVNTYLSSSQNITFDADWVLVVKWINVCERSTGDCTAGRPTPVNTFQAIIASQGSQSYTVFTYECDKISWSLDGYFAQASVGFSAGPYFFANHPLSNKANVTDIDCINQPDSVWSNVVYKLSTGDDSGAPSMAVCQPECVNGNCVEDDVCSCNSGWTGSICDIYICEPDCINGTCTGPNTCQCNAGWNGTICSMDINECDNSSICHPSECRNTEGSYYCYCEAGYQLVKENNTCEDIDECLLNVDNCTEKCNNTIGSHTCYHCVIGYSYDNITDNCLNDNECNYNKGGCEHNCTDTDGSYYCYCRDGYRLYDNMSCSDIDECEENSHNCFGSHENCSNTFGSYECYCMPGYNRSVDGICEDINECDVPGNGGCTQHCNNTEGSYYCSCEIGYNLTNDGFGCEDINECDDVMSNNCHQNCDNTLGSYTCSCYQGYSLINGNECQAQTCIEILHSPSNGTLECTDVGVVDNSTGLVVNAICNITCSRGYELMGSSQRTCLSNRVWSGQSASCKPLQCPTLALDNGFIQLPCSRDYSTSCRVRCFEGYQINGSDTINCSLLEDSSFIPEWSTPGKCEEVPVCTDATCLHGGICSVSPDSEGGYVCDCTGTLYTGKRCDRGLIQTSFIGEIKLNNIITLNLTANPDTNISVKFGTTEGECISGSGGGQIFLVFGSKCPLNITNDKRSVSAHFVIIKPAIYYLYFSVSGENEKSFLIPDTKALPVNPSTSPSKNINFTDIQPSCFTPENSNVCDSRTCVRLTSSCEWNINNLKKTMTTGGIVHATGDGISFPISLLGLTFTGSVTGFGLKSSFTFTDSDISSATLPNEQASTECNNLMDNDNCYNFRASEADKIEFIKKQSLSTSFIKEIQRKLLPQWVTLTVTVDNNVLDRISDTDFKVNITVTADQVRAQAGCEYIDVDSGGLFAVLQHDGPLRMELQTSNTYETINLTSPSIGSVYCIAVNLSEGKSSPVYFGIPLSSSMALNELSFIKKYLDKGWEFSFNSINIQKSPMIVPTDNISYWNNIIPDYRRPPIDANIAVSMETDASFNLDQTSVKIKFNGNISYQYTANDMMTNEFNALGIWTTVITTFIHNKMENIELSDSDTITNAYVHHTTVPVSQCDVDETQSGLAVKLFYTFNQGQPFYQSLLQLPFDTPKCPIDMFLSLDTNQNMSGLSLYSECIDISYNSLIFEMLSHKIYFPMTTICNESIAFSQRYPDRDSFGLIIHSSLMNTSRLPLEVYFTLLPGTDNTSVSMGFMKSSSDKVGLIHSVQVNLLDSSFTVPIALSNDELSFTATSRLYGNDFYNASFIGQANVAQGMSWDRLTLELSGYFPKLPGHFVQAIQDSINETFTMRTNEAMRRKEEAENLVDKSRSDKDELMAEYDECRHLHNRTLNDIIIANRSLILAEAEIANTTAEIANTPAEQSIDDICQLKTCLPQCVNVSRTRTVYEPQYVTTVASCESTCRVSRVVRVNPFYEFTNNWRFVLCCFLRIVDCGQDDCLLEECEYRSICKAVRVLKPVYNYVNATFEEFCVVPCNKTTYNGTIERTETFIDPCGQSIFEPNCIASNEKCDTKRQMALDSIREKRREIFDLINRRNIARRTLGSAESQISRLELKLKMSTDKLTRLQTQYNVAERILSASVINRERVNDLIANDIKLYQSYTAIDVTNVTFTITFRGTSPVALPINIIFNASPSQRELTFTTFYNFIQPFQQQKASLANSIIDELISDGSTSKRRKRAEPVTPIEQNKLDFQIKCAELTSVNEFLQYIFNSLQNSFILSQKLQSETSALIQSIDDMTYSALNVPPVEGNYTAFQAIFNVTQDDINNQPNVAIEDSILSNILETFGDLRNSTSEILNDINRTVYEQWSKELTSLLLNDGSIADKSCYGFGDCLLVLTNTVEDLLSFAPLHISNDLSFNVRVAANELISIATSSNLTITEALNKLSPIMSIVSSMDENGYWCASPPTFITHPVAEANVSVGDMLTLTCSGESALPLRYSWRKDSVLIPGADSSTLHVNDFRVFDEGNYTCHITNDVGTVQSINASVHGYILPEFYLTPVPVITYFGNGNGARFTCNATSRPDPGWKWFFRSNIDSEWKEVIGEETNEILIIQPGADDVGYYRCLVYNDHGNLSSNAAYLQLLSVTSRAFGSSLEFTMNDVHEDNKRRKKRDETVEDTLLTILKDDINFGSTSLDDIKVEYLSDGATIRVIISLISANTTIGTLSLPEVVQKQVNFKTQLNDVLNDIRNYLRRSLLNINTTSGLFAFDSNSLRSSTPEILCPKGQAIHSDNRYLCMDCLEGQHQIVVEETRLSNGLTVIERVPRCSSCPLNSYQDEIGGGDCIPCPENHITFLTGSKSFNDCVAVCPPNTKSINGYGPCERCPTRTYQPGIGQITCIPCQNEEDDANCITGPCEIDAGSFRQCSDDNKRLTFYYNTSQGLCLPIPNGMCSSNKNIFSQYSDCFNTCGCYGNTNVTTCAIDPCSTSTCPNYPDAQCVSDYCSDDCTSRYYFNNVEVTDLCNCPKSMVLIPCPKTCQPTCQIPQPTSCKEIDNCMPTCGCPEGTVLDEVNNLCINEDECDTCSLSANAGPCHGTYPRWFFNSTSKQCEHFSYGGCNGNSNRFTSLQSCIDACGCGVGSPHACDVSPCGTSSCPSYPNAVCEVDKCNNSTCTAKHFVAFDDVTDTCNICEIDVDPGPCNDNITRWHYSSELSRCQQFTYGGCEGNRNNFKTIQECIDSCNSKCPLGISSVQCSDDICQSSSCRNHPQATCVVRSCGQCTAHYYNSNGVEITPMCNECPPDQPPVNCLIDYCKYQKCLEFPQADCIMDKCGSCKTKYFINETEVTDQCSYCPVEGEIFKECILSCRQTCSNIIMDRPLICNASCSPGCECPAGQILDELAMKCVYPEECSCPPCEPVSPNCTNLITPDNHICSCPICADCPVKGQQYKMSGAGCPHTCTSYKLLCTGSDNPGCSCPDGQVINEEINECVDIDNCPKPDPCTLSVDRGPCNYRIPRYFYNTTSRKCERFEYGGCFGNENNYFSLYDCEEKCSSCPPTCSPEFCAVKRNSICTLQTSSSTCHRGSCELSNCLACYYSYNTLPLPTGAGDCNTDCTEDGQLVQSCVSSWGVCIRKAYFNTYNQVQVYERIPDNFRCWKYSCQ